MDKQEYLEKRTVLLNEADKLIVENKISDFENKKKEIENATRDLEYAESKYDLETAARLRHGTIPALEKELSALKKENKSSILSSYSTSLFYMRFVFSLARILRYFIWCALFLQLDKRTHPHDVLYNFQYYL